MNITTVYFTGGRTGKAQSLTQYDYGQILQFSGIDLPEIYEVYFSNDPTTPGKAKKQIGTASGVTIPDEYLLTGLPVYAWVYVHTGDSDGETVYSVMIPVRQRAEPTPEEPTPVQQDAITEAIAAMQEMVTHSPVIEEGHWYIWQDGEYVDTGVSAEGLPGEKGDKGDPGSPGSPGSPGKDGEDGHTPVITASKSGKVTTIYVDGTAIATINDGQDGYTPVRGTDYWTAEDKAEIVAEAVESIPVDTELSGLSTNAVQNKVITEGLNNLHDAVDNLSRNLVLDGYESIPGLYINATSGNIVKQTGTQTLNLLVFPCLPNTKYKIWKATETIMRVSSGSVETPVGGTTGHLLGAHAEASSDAIEGKTGVNDTYLYVQLYTTSDAAALRNVNANVKSLIIIESIDNAKTEALLEQVTESKSNQIADFTGLPVTVSPELSTVNATIWTATGTDNQHFVTFKPDKTYLSVALITVNSAGTTATVGTVRLANYQKGSSTTTPTNVSKRGEFACATGAKDTPTIIWNIAELKEEVVSDTDVYYKIITANGGTAARTYDVTISDLFCFEFDTQAEAESFLDFFGYWVHSGYYSAVDKKARLHVSDIETRLDDFAPAYDADMLFWGDSLTAGAGGEGTNYPAVCATALGLTYLNCGVGGETANTISARQGGNSIVLPAGPVNGDYATLTDVFGTEIEPLLQGTGSDSGRNVIVNGETCWIGHTTANGYTISGYTGSPLLVPTPVSFQGSSYAGRIVCIFVGQNGASIPGQTSLESRITIIDSMIKHIGHSHYVILGLSTGTDESRSEEDATLLAKYGSKFFPTRRMLVANGLTLAGITPTATDSADVAVGRVPTSLRSDGIHLNASGYRALGLMVADKIRSLGYVEMPNSEVSPSTVSLKGDKGDSGAMRVVAVTGSSVTISGEDNVMYLCGEVTDISITPPASGIMGVRFTSGSTSTLLTLTGATMPSWFDATALETNTVYEMSFMDGFGVVTTWEA